VRSQSEVKRTIGEVAASALSACSMVAFTVEWHVPLAGSRKS
jgi:hypothetical protein